MTQPVERPAFETTTTPRGEIPRALWRLAPKRDYDDWKAILVRAGIPTARLHDARHTAATLHLEAGIQERVVQHQFGWSSGAMLPTYQHPTEELAAPPPTPSARTCSESHNDPRPWLQLWLQFPSIRSSSDDLNIGVLSTKWTMTHPLEWPPDVLLTT